MRCPTIPGDGVHPGARSSQRSSRLRVAALAALFVVVLVLAAARVPAAFADTSTFPGTFSADKYPRYLPTDHTTVAMQIELDGSTPYHFTDGFYYLKLAFCPTSTFDPVAARGYTWNPTSSTWVQAQQDWADFPQVDVINDVVQVGTNNGVLWRFAQFGDESVATSGLSTTWYAFWLLAPVGRPVQAEVCASPVQVTLLDMATDGGWLHNATASGIASAQYGSRAETTPGGYTAPWALSKVEPNQGDGVAACDDGAQDVVPAAAYEGGFLLWAPYSVTSPPLFWASEQKGNKTWPSPAAATLQVPAPDTNVAVSNTAGADMTPPSAPGTLTATPTTAGIRLDWGSASDAVGVTGYRVYRWTDATPINGVITYTPFHRLLPSPGSWVTTSGATTYLDSAVTPGVSYHYEVRAIDAASNVGPRSGTATATQPVDLPPVTVATGLALTADSAWTNTSGQFTLSATDDDLTPVASTFYTIDGALGIWDGDPVPVIGEGSHQITFWSVDTGGLAESPNVGYVNIDLTKPTVSDSAPTAWSNTDVTVPLTAGDTGGSGLAGTQYRLQGASSWTPATGGQFVVAALPDHQNDGAVAYDYEATDRAGNVSDIGTCTVRIDTTAPVTTATVAQSPVDGLYAAPVTVSLVATDTGGSGVARVSYSIDGGAAVDTSGATATATVSSAGSHTVSFWATDNAGNVEDSSQAANSLTFDVGADIAPQTTDDAPTGWVNTPQTVTLTATDDGGPGVDYTTFSTDGGQTWSHGRSVAVPVPGDGSNDGVHTILYYSVDKNDVHEKTESCAVQIDTQAPTVDDVTPLDGARYVMGSGATVAWTATDAPALGADSSSGIDSETATIDGQTVLSGDSLDAAGPGTHTFTLTVADLAGNETTLSRVFTNLSETLGVAAPFARASWQNGTTQMVRFSIDDPLAGGQFGIWLVDAAGNATQLKTLTPVDGQRLYTVSVPVDATPGSGYHVRVAWRTDAAASTWPLVATSGAFAVTPAQAISVSDPGAATIWQRLTSHTVRWSLASPVTGGQFEVWLIDHDHTWQPAGIVAARRGVTSYSARLRVTVAAGVGRVAVRWRRSPRAAWGMSGMSPSFNVVGARSLRIAVPASHVSWQRGKDHTVSWRFAYAQSGQFGVWLVSAAGRSYALSTITPTTWPGIFSATVRPNVPAGAYRLVVRWRCDGTAATWPLRATSAPITIRK